MPEEDLNNYVTNCVFDACALGTADTMDAVCEHSAALAAECQALYDYDQEWRSSDFCRTLLILSNSEQ